MFVTMDKVPWEGMKETKNGAKYNGLRLSMKRGWATITKCDIMRRVVDTNLYIDVFADAWIKRERFIWRRRERNLQLTQ